MRIILFTGLLPALTALDHIRSNGWLKAIVSTDKMPDQKAQLRDLCKNYDIPFFEVAENDMVQVVGGLFNDIRPDAAIMFGFSYRIPPAIYQIPPLGFYNVHFSLLPAYRGPDPVFYQLKNGEHTSGVSIHKINEKFDNGEIVMQQPLPLIHGETWGLCFARHIPLAASMVIALCHQLKENNFLPAITGHGQRSSYYKKVTPVDTMIRWDMHDAEKIEQLVNACNPAVGGALTFYRQLPVRIFEVSQVDGGSDQDAPAGTIVHAGADGLFVQCLGRRFLRINILSLTEGVITGAKFAALGIRPGDRFETIEAVQRISTDQVVQ